MKKLNFTNRLRVFLLISITSILIYSSFSIVDNRDYVGDDLEMYCFDTHIGYLTDDNNIILAFTGK